jgi:hypothetical protein
MRKTPAELQQFHRVSVSPIANHFSHSGLAGIAKMAERTGLEPATPGVTGRYSNQLNYRSALNRLLVDRRLVRSGP